MSFFEGLKFRKVSSPIHDLDPRVKFVFVCVIFVSAVIFNELVALLVLFVVPLPFVFMGKVFSQWLRSMRGAALFAAMIFFTNLIFNYIYSNYIVTSSMLEYSISMTIRFLVLVGSFSIFFLTTSPDHLGLALEQSHVPYEFCFAFITAVRFVPVLAEEAQAIMDAQKARGLELEKGNFLKRIRNYIPILIPLIVGAIRRSLELAEAMESRAWGATEKRTNLYALELKRKDYVMIAVTALILAFSVYTRLFLPIPSVTQLFY